MKAVILSEHGGPEVLRAAEMPEPVIGDRDVLVRVRACALNHLDLWVRGGLPGRNVPLPHIPGSDISGEVAKVGSAVTNVKVGERVLLAPGVSCGQCEQCVAGRDNFCADYALFGRQIHGGYAEFVRSPSVNVIPIPGNLTFEEAAAIPLVFLTAWHMLFTRAQLRPSEEVLVIAAGSGVGSAAIQIAKATGARVIATAGFRAEACESEGAWRRRDSAAHGRIRARSEASDRWPRRGRRLRARRPGHLGTERVQPQARRPPGHLRRDHRPRGEDQYQLSLRAAAFDSGFVHGQQVRALFARSSSSSADC